MSLTSNPERKTDEHDSKYVSVFDRQTNKSTSIKRAEKELVFLSAEKRDKGGTEVDKKLMEKVERLREISKEIKEYDDLLFMYERDKIDLALLKKEVFEIIATL